MSAALNPSPAAGTHYWWVQEHLPLTPESDMAEEQNDWDRRDEEPLEAWRCFTRYYLAAGLNRTVRKAWLAYVKAAEPEKLDAASEEPTPSQWRNWAVEYNWYARAEAWEHDQDDQALSTVEDAARLLRSLTVEAVTALALALKSERFRVGAAKEILDRAGLPATVRQEVDSNVSITSDDLSTARTEVERWESERLQETEPKESGSSAPNPAGTS